MARTLADVEPLTRKAIERFVEEVLSRQKDNVVKIVLFGSVARGDYNKDSDIDVFLLLKHYSRTDAISDDLTQSSIIADEENNYDTYTTPFALSLKNYAYGEQIGEQVIKNIKREGIILYDATK